MNMDYEEVNPNKLLDIAVEMINGTIGKNSFVISKIFVEIRWHYPYISHDISGQQKFLKIHAKTAMKLNPDTAEQIILSTLHEKRLQYGESIFKVEEKIFVYSKKNSHWIGPFLVVHEKGTTITKKAIDCFQKWFNFFRAEPFCNQINFQYWNNVP